MTSQFYLSAPSSQSLSPTSQPASRPSTDSDLSDFDTLPFAKPLPRQSFLAPNFSPQEYLSSLSATHRHQTLEDLRTELRDRVQLLQRELLDLVNTNYTAFLDLGKDLKGGEEKVEGVRVGLLGLSRQVEDVKAKVGERRAEVGELLGERREVRKDIQTGRALLDVEARLGELEGGLMVSPATPHKSPLRETQNGSRGDEDEEDEEELLHVSDDSDFEDDEDDDNPDGLLMAVGKVQRNVQQYLIVKRLIDKVGADHPFLVAQQSRMARIRSTLLLDLGAALKQARGAGDSGKSRVLRVVGILRDMDEADEAVRLLKGR